MKVWEETGRNEEGGSGIEEGGRNDRLGSCVSTAPA